MFKKFFAGKGVTDSQIEDYAKDFTVVAVLTLLGATEERLDETDRETIKGLWLDGKLDDIVRMVKERYTADQWQAIVNAHIKPLLDDYFKKILNT